MGTPRLQRDQRKGSKYPTIESLKADTPDGHCIMCQEPLRGQQIWLCGAEYCGRSYHRVVAHDRWRAYAANREANSNSHRYWGRPTRHA